MRWTTFSSRLIFSGTSEAAGHYILWAATGKTLLLACIQLLCERHTRAAETPACSDAARSSTAAGFAAGSPLFPAKPDVSEKGFHRSGETKEL